MLAYAVKRLLLCVPTFIGITIVTFAVINLAPGDPALNGTSPTGDAGVTPETYQRIRQQFHLDAPLHQRYVHWLGDLVRLDLGRSFHDGRSVTRKIVERLPPTLWLTVSAMLLSFAVSIPLGVRAAMGAGGWFDGVLGGVCFSLYAVPRYVMAMLLILIVGVRLEWFPFMGMTSDGFISMSVWGKLVDVLRHAVLIGLCFVYPLVAYQVRFVRANVLAVLGEDFIRTARAKGASELRVAYHHALRNALLPLLTLMGLMLPAVLGGSVILEVMFSWPGMGRLLFDAIMQRDYPVVMGLAVMSAVVVLVGTLLVDLLYAVADPRVRYA